MEYREIIGHSGVAIGSTADVYYFPNRGLTISLYLIQGKGIAQLRRHTIKCEQRSR